MTGRPPPRSEPPLWSALLFAVALGSLLLGWVLAAAVGLEEFDRHFLYLMVGFVAAVASVRLVLNDGANFWFRLAAGPLVFVALFQTIGSLLLVFLTYSWA